MKVESFCRADAITLIRVCLFPPHGSTFHLTIPEARELYAKLTPIVAPDPLIAECLETRRARELWEQGITSTPEPSSD